MKTILLVDDDQMIIDLYHMKFTKLGYNVLTSSEPATVPQLIQDNHPALLLLDRRMGEVDGLDVFKSLRAQDFGKLLPVIILSNQDPTPEEFAMVKSLGHCDYLIKEKIDLNELGKKIGELTADAPNPA